MNNENKSVIITGRDNILAFRERTLLIGLRLEVRCPGMRLTGKTHKCSTIIKREYGLKGRPARLLEQFEALMAEKQAARDLAHQDLAHQEWCIRELVQNAIDNEPAHEDHEDGG